MPNKDKLPPAMRRDAAGVLKFMEDKRKKQAEERAKSTVDPVGQVIRPKRKR